MVIAASLLGALTGIVTGLVPGIHVNTVTALLLASSASCASLGIEYSALLAFTCALAISHTFFDVVPGLFLGIPGDETFALLPGHELVKQGHGNLAIRLSVAGSAVGLIIGVVLVVALLTFGNVIGAFEDGISPWMFWILLAVSAVLILSDSPRGWSLVVFLASGLLGVAVFGTPLVAGGSDAPINALFPALAGLFGVAGLVFAIATAGPPSGSPPLSKESPNPTVDAVAGPGVRGGFAGLVVGLLPGLGAANAATLLLLLERWFGRRVSRDKQSRAYLVTTSSLNTAEALFAIAALYLIGRSRSGASIAVEQILGGIVAPSDLLLISLFMVVAGVIAAVMLWRMGASIARWVGKTDELGLNWGVVAFLAALTLLLLGLGGLAILVCATVVGLVPLVFKVRRAQLMGFFLVPTMLFYSGQQGRVVDWLSLEQRTAPLLPSVTLTGIALAVLASVAVALAAYRLARWIAATRKADSPTYAVSKVGKLAGFATSTVAAVILLIALFGGAYPREEFVAGRIPARLEWAYGRVARVIDGDTADIASACRRFRVRFSGVDAPELGSAAGDRARDWTRSTFENQAVEWRAVGVDAFGRFLGLLQLPDGTSVNQEIVRQGYARPNGGAPLPGQTPLPPSTSTPQPPATPTDRAAATGTVTEVLPWDDDGNGRVSCAEARSHGIVPVRRGHPAYPYMRDADGDGVVCE